MMLRFIRSLALAAVLFSGAHASAANLLVNGDFEDDVISASPWFIRTATQPTGWTQFGDGVDIVHNNYFPGVTIGAQSGSNYLDLNQVNPGNLLGGIYQDVLVAAGMELTLTLYASRWAENGDGQIRYQLIDASNSSVLATADYTVTPTWVQRTLTAIAPASGQVRVRIESIISEQAAPGLDNVALTAIPEPASLTLLTLGSLTLLRRRR